MVLEFVRVHHDRPWESWLILEIEIAERLPGGVLHDEARIVMLPRSFKAAGSGVGLAVAGDLKNVPARP